MNIYIIGAEGSVGKEMLKLGCRPLEVDVTDLYAVTKLLEEAYPRPEVVINLAGKSHPDFCEVKENTDIVVKVNVRGAYNVATVTEQMNIPAVFLSTDHIFDGKHGPYREASKLTVPANFYGQSKMAMEAVGMQFDNVKLVRTSHLFGRETQIAQKDYPTFLNRSFMYLPHFAKSLYEYALRISDMPKILHIAGSQTISWYEFALALASELKIDKETILPRRKEWKASPDGPLFAPRPHKAGLVVTLSKKLGLPQHDFVDGLQQMHEDSISHILGY